MESTAAQQHDLAGWGARAGAAIVDNVLLALPFVLAIALVLSAGDEDDASGVWIPAIFLFLASFVGPFLYFPLLNGNQRGQTLGKRLTGVRVRSRDGGPLGLGRGFGRYAFVAAVGFFFAPALIIDYLWPLWDGQNQALHDKVVDSIVVKA